MGSDETAQLGKARPPEVCFLCCRTIDVRSERTTEHVLPHCFYEGRKVPEDGPTSPAHYACNRSTSLDEQTIFVAIGQTTVSPTHTPELRERANRTLKRSAAFEQGFRAHVTMQEGIPYVSPPQLPMTRVMAKIVKGLMYRETRTLFGEDWRWTVRAPEPDIPMPADEPRWLVVVPSDGADRGTALAARGFVEGPDLFVWHLLLNAAHQVLVFVSHKDSPLGAPKGPHDLMQLVWPI